MIDVIVDDTGRPHVTNTTDGIRTRRFSVGNADTAADDTADATRRPHVPRKVGIIRVRRLHP